TFIPDPLGVLTGLIGEKGAVGVWHRITREGQGSGGFIAAPSAAPVVAPVEHYAAWQASFDDTPADTLTSAENRFLQVSQVEIPAQGGGNSTFVTGFKNLITQPDPSGRAANADTLNMRDALYLPKGSNQAGRALGGNANNVVYFDYGYYHAPGTDKTANGIVSYHAAIGEDANMGAALPVWESQQLANAVWKGSFRGQRFNYAPTVNNSFELEVDFQNRRVEAFVPVNSGIEAATVHYHLRGEFPEDLNGALIGTVDRGDFINNDRLQPNGDNTPGVFTGLIGQHGAIGAFVSGTRAGSGSALQGGGGETGYSGGFVACPYDEVNNRCVSQ
nr:hypothetical protein [Pseudomonadota bacterium]